MAYQIKIYPAPLVIPSIQPDKDSGSSISFKGYVRQLENDATITGISYEAFEEMAYHQFSLICKEAMDKWKVSNIIVHHVTEFVPVNNPSIFANVVSPHRAQGFQALQYVLTEMKVRVPIWKTPKY